ncbi:MAG TPA: hypothetical protein VMW48_01825 [Vicinamibacterales bacterium]|nr:hypothetical protein [Vicinamibacterales bacterium]
MWRELAMFDRYRRGLEHFLSEPVTAAEAERTVRARLAVRSQAFAEFIDRAVFQVPASPYLRLMEHAGVTTGDVAELVARRGVEGALDALFEAGVRLSLHEFKGRVAIRRGSLTVPASHHDFDNPLRNEHFAGMTSGSSGSRRRLLLDLAMVAHDAACYEGFCDAFSIAERPMGVWRPVPPDNSGIKKLLMRARANRPVERWFTQQPFRWGGGQARYAAFTAYTLRRCRQRGHRLPSPEHVPLDQAGLVAEWLADAVAAGRPAHLDTLVSAAVRVCLAARRSIAGTFFRVGSEPLTPEKARIIRAAGCTAGVHYSTAETGPIAMGCGVGQDADDLHLLTSKVALITTPAPEPSRSRALHLTSLLPSSPKLLLNVELGDVAEVEDRACACALGRWGLHTHLHAIRSYEKLTGEGVTFLGSDLVTLLEDVLPREIGGTPLDYQMREDEQGGLSIVSLLVSPRLGPIDEARVTAVVHAHLGARDVGHRLMSSLWRQGQTLRIRRQEPVATPSGKVLPLGRRPRHDA